MYLKKANYREKLNAGHRILVCQDVCAESSTNHFPLACYERFWQLTDPGSMLQQPNFRGFLPNIEEKCLNG
jgi:hypothetical protein